jgi:hypothetical protein
MTASMIPDEVFNPLRYWSDEAPCVPKLDAQDAVLDREDSLSERYAFQLGENLGVCRLVASTEWPCDAMAAGYAHGLVRPRRHAGVFLRKLLTLRKSAFARGIPVSSALTAEYLQEISVTVCPVTGVALTQGAQLLTDWSLDRLDNELGYVPGNVCFMSTRANRLKGTLSFESACEEALEAAAMQVAAHGAEGYLRDLGNGMTVIEMMRVAALMAGPSSYVSGRLGKSMPFAMAPKVWSSVAARVACVHVGCARTKAEGAHHRKRLAMFKHLGKDLWRTSGKLLEAIRSCLEQGMHPCDLGLMPTISTPLMMISEAFVRMPPPYAMVLRDEEVVQTVSAMLSSVGQYVRKR